MRTNGNPACQHGIVRPTRIPLGVVGNILLYQAAALAHTCGSTELVVRVAVNRARLAVYRGELFTALRILQQAGDTVTDAEDALDRATIALEEANLFERLHMAAEAFPLARLAADGFAAAGLLTESCEARLLATRLALDLRKPIDARRDPDHARMLVQQTTLSPVIRALLEAYAAHPQFHRTAAARQAALQRADDAVAVLNDLRVPHELPQARLIAASLAATLRHPDAETRYRMVIDQAHQYGFLVIEQQAWEGVARTLRPSRAWEPLQRAVDLAAQIRQTMPIEEVKAHYLHGLAPLSGRLVTAYLKRKRSNQALQALLAAKGSIWIDSALPADPVPRDPEWVRAKTDVQYWHDYHRQACDPDDLALARARLHQAEDAFTRAARRQVRRRPPQELPDVPTIHAHLTASDGALEYLVSDGTIYVCVITADAEPAWINLGPVVAVEHLLGRFGLLRMTLQQRSTLTQRRHGAEQQHGAAEKVLAELYQTLVAPIESRLPGTRLLIAPDGVLFDVPWTALWHGDGYLGQGGKSFWSRRWQCWRYRR
jgi:hypothetical protein